jgi:hypothetical protein
MSYKIEFSPTSNFSSTCEYVDAKLADEYSDFIEDSLGFVRYPSFRPVSWLFDVIGHYVSECPLEFLYWLSLLGYSCRLSRYDDQNCHLYIARFSQEAGVSPVDYNDETQGMIRILGYGFVVKAHPSHYCHFTEKANYDLSTRLITYAYVEFDGTVRVARCGYSYSERGPSPLIKVPLLTDSTFDYCRHGYKCYQRITIHNYNLYYDESYEEMLWAVTLCDDCSARRGHLEHYPEPLYMVTSKGSTKIHESKLRHAQAKMEEWNRRLRKLWREASKKTVAAEKAKTVEEKVSLLLLRERKYAAYM